MKKTQKSSKGKFETLFEAAMEDENLFDSGDDVIEDYEDNVDEINDEFKDEGEEGGDVTITLTADQVSVLRDVLAQLDGGEEEESFEDEDEEDDVFGGGDDEFDDVSDIDELEREAVEFENAPDAESVRAKTKSGKAEGTVKPGDFFKKETEKKDGEEKQYKFVKREKPQELKHKTTKGS